MVAEQAWCVIPKLAILPSDISQSQIWSPTPTSISIKGGTDFQGYLIYEQGFIFKMKNMSVYVLKP